MNCILCITTKLVNVPSKKHFGAPYFYYSYLDKLVLSNLDKIWNSRIICPLTIKNTVILVIARLTLWTCFSLARDLYLNKTYFDNKGIYSKLAGPLHRVYIQQPSYDIPSSTESDYCILSLDNNRQ